MDVVGAGFASQGQEGFYAVMAGELAVREKDNVIELQAGELLFVRRGTYLVATRWVRCQVLWLPLDVNFVQAFMQRHGKELSHLERCGEPCVNALRLDPCAMAQECVTRLAALGGEGTSSMLAMLRLEELLLLLVFGPQGRTLLAALRQQGNRHADRLHAFMEQHYLREWRLDQYAEAFGLGLTAFKSLFCSLYNCSPRAWITERRIVHAHHLLLNTRMSIVDIAMESGFSSQSYFSQSYRRRFGCTPSDARR
ncbi:helix-turn-helix transcriptional regulator [Pseudomonas mosselii]|uniref:AraC family transcriptional regulator n=1 Tax=Pseudomonas mosselii TaxID=78327 RepID=A0AA42RX06_9PSED|nr:AraC family transcriptional regulator [Pseudomonas mosselii]MDH1631117.1 AraC family transcriptional regulator [Pseudomonas mosselii]PYC28630.1 AraC family transcriptional regulator [Pseudomonas mosselii]